MRTRASGAIGGQLAKFALVGGVGFVVDVGVFNLLRFTVLDPSVIHAGPLIAKTISTILAIGANWLGNRYWTFGPHRSTRSAAEAMEFLAVSILGMLVGLACLWVSHYMLGLTSPLADNISTNVIGLLLGSIVRFALYRHWVYHPARRNRVGATAASQPTHAVD
jgi:putative flippase GtrA